MNLVKINDNTKTEKDVFINIPKLTNCIVNKTLKQLEQEGVFVFPESVDYADDISKDQMILQSVNDNLCSGNVMGFIGYGNEERLIINSRFSGDNEDYFVQYLLQRVLDLPNIVDLKSDADQDNRIFNFLLFLFPYYLKSAMRKGIFKKYVRNRYNDSNVKGIIDIAKHIEKNIPFIGKIAYTQREFSSDNYLTELIRHTIEYIKRKPYGNKILSQVQDEVRLVIDITSSYELYDRQRVIEKNKKFLVHHAYYHEYLALQKLCLQILQHQKHKIGSGVSEIYGILFDGAWLWEEYLNSLICDKFYHPMNKEKKGRQRLFYNVDRRRDEGEIYPDFISKSQENSVIADAKYKLIGNIGNKDYLQLLAYMLRFDAKLGYYLYPNDEDKRECIQTLKLNKGSTFKKDVEPRDDIWVIKLGLNIPKEADNYEKFVEQMNDSEKDFVNQMNDCEKEFCKQLVV